MQIRYLWPTPTQLNREKDTGKCHSQLDGITEQTFTGVTSKMKKSLLPFSLKPVFTWFRFNKPTQCQARCQIFSHTHTHTHTHTHPHINTTSLVATHHMLLFLISIGHRERKIMKSLHRPGTLLTRCKQQHSWRQCYVTVRRESSGVSGSKFWVLLHEA